MLPQLWSFTHDSKLLFLYIFPVHNEDSTGAVLQVLPLEESTAYNWELEDGGIFSSSHDQLDGWSPKREWPDRPLPGAPPNTTELPSALKDKIEQDIQHLLTNLKETGFDISLKDSSKEPVTVPILYLLIHPSVQSVIRSFITIT